MSLPENNNANERYIIVSREQSSQSDVDLIDLIRMIWVKKIVFFSVFVTSIILSAIVIVFSTPVYEARSVLIPASSENRQANLNSLIGPLGNIPGLNSFGSDSSGNTILATNIFLSRAFATDFIESNNLKPLLFDDRWDDISSNWIGGEPSEGEAFRLYNRIVSIEEDIGTGIVTISIEWEEPESAAAWVNMLVSSINEQVKQRDIEEAQNSLNFLNSQILEESVVDMRQVLFNLIQIETQKIMLANVRDDYVFRIIDPAIAPENPVRPNSQLILILGSVIGIFVGAFLSIFLAIRADEKIDRT